MSIDIGVRFLKSGLSVATSAIGGVASGGLGNFAGGVLSQIFSSLSNYGVDVATTGIGRNVQEGVNGYKVSFLKTSMLSYLGFLPKQL